MKCDVVPSEEEASRLNLAWRVVQPIVLCMLLLGPGAVFAQDCIEYGDYIHRLGIAHVTDDLAADGVISGSHAYVATTGSHNFLRIVDLTNPASPTQVDSIDMVGMVNDLAVQDSYLYAACSEIGLRIFDISNPLAPSAVATVPPISTGYVCVTVSGPWAYCGTDLGELVQINILDPYTPWVETSVPDPHGTFFPLDHVARSGDFVYGVSENGVMMNAYFTAPSVLLYFGSVPLTGMPVDIAVSGSYAYVACDSEALQIYDVSNPSAPVWAAMLPFRASATAYPSTDRVLIDGGLAYVAESSGDFGSAVRVVDISDPIVPVVVKEIEASAWWCYGLGVDDGLAITVNYYDPAYYNTGTFITVLDIAKPAPDPIGVLDTPGRAQGVFLRGSYAFIADASSLRIADITNPALPTEVGSVTLESGSAGRVWVDGDYAYLIGMTSGVFIADVSNPAAPSLVATLDTPGSVYDVVVREGRAYIADKDYGLQIADVSSPTSPSIILSCDTPGTAYGVALVGNHAYVADGAGGLQVVDISDPGVPIVGQLSVSNAYRIGCDGAYAYIGCSYFGLTVVDISNPTLPVLAGSYLPSHLSGRVAFDGDYIYMAGAGGGMEIYDRADPTSLVPVGSYQTQTSAAAVAVSGDYAYLAAGTAGLLVLPAQCGEVVPGGPIQVPGDYATIQAAINAASPGETIEVAAGLYAERLTINKAIDLRGAQYGIDPTPAEARTNPAAESIVDITGLGTPNPNVAIEIPDGVTGVSIDGFTLIGSPTFHYADEVVIRAWDSDIATKNCIISGYQDILWKGPGSGFTVEANRITANKNGIILQPGTGSDVTILGNTFTLGSAPATDAGPIYLTGIDGATISGNAAAGWTGGSQIAGSNNSHCDIVANSFTGGVKGVNFWGTTTFITVVGNIFTGQTNAGVGIKGQDIEIRDNSISGNQVGVKIEFNVITTERVTIRGNDLSGNTGLSLEVGDTVVDTVDASGNWYGSSDPAVVAAEVTAGKADYTPWLASGADTSADPGFQGDFTGIWIDDSSPQVGGLGRFAEGLEMVSGSTITVAPGSYAETITFPADYAKAGVTIEGAAGSRPAVTGGVLIANAGAINGLTLRNLLLTGVPTGSDEILRFANTGAVNDFAIDLCVVDGENVSGRHGLAGNLLGASFSVTNSEFKRILGFAVLDMDSSSDYSPWGGNGLPLTAVIFSDNYVHECNGTISLRGHYVSKTPLVTVEDNKIENIGGNEGEQGEQWAGIEINHAQALSFLRNAIDNVSQGAYGEGQAVQLWDVETIDMRNNSMASCYQGLYVFGGGSGNPYGGPYAVPGGSITTNNISGNSQYGVSVDPGATGGPMTALGNWWGDASGPLNATLNPDGLGNSVSDNVLFDPWIGAAGSENVVCLADPEEISHADWTGSLYAGVVTARYLGGGSDALYGYSIDVEWDNAIVNLVSITRPASGPFATAPLFQVVNLGESKRRVDAALGADHPGTLGPDDLFRVTYSGVACGSSPVNLTPIKFRNAENQTLYGFFEDDGEVVVDTEVPVITLSSITRTNLMDTGYAKNGDDLTVAVTITDGCGVDSLEVLADFSGLLDGGGAAVTPTSYAGGVATWILTDVTLASPDGLKTATVTVTDALGNMASQGVTIYADNTKPTVEVTALTATTAHNEVALAWTNPSEDPDLDNYGIMIRRGDWAEVDYPEYTGAEAVFPDSVGGTRVLHSVGMPASYDDVFASTGAERDIHAYTVFVFDRACNYSVGTTAPRMVTNYWLGDVSPNSWPTSIGDGRVETIDISALGGTYYLPTDNALWNPHCDVGPTDDGSRFGIPLTDGLVDFEDLMIFSMNYTRVLPLQGEGPTLVSLGSNASGGIALGIGPMPARVHAGQMLRVPILLRGDVQNVQGVRAALRFDQAIFRFDGAEVSSAIGSEEHFFMCQPLSSSVGLDLALLGADASMEGEGTVFIVRLQVLHTGAASFALTGGKVRDTANRDLLPQADERPVGPAVEEPLVAVPTDYRLGDARPNPFNPRTTIYFDLPEAGAVRVQVFDVSGRVVRTLIDATRTAGAHSVEWDGTDDMGHPLTSGIYFYTMQAGDYRSQRRVTLLK